MLEFVDIGEGYVPYLRTGEIAEDIVKWDVAWMTPKGLLLKLDDAIAWCKSVDLDPNMILRPIVIARTENDYEAFP